MNRMERESATVGKMIAMYCRHHHGSRQGLCDSCRMLLDYAVDRLRHCPDGEAKTSCRKCVRHCYAPAHRQRIREVMRYVGPRMIFHHPLAAIRHIVDEYL